MKHEQQSAPAHGVAVQRMVRHLHRREKTIMAGTRTNNSPKSEVLTGRTSNEKRNKATTQETKMRMSEMKGRHLLRAELTLAAAGVAVSVLLFFADAINSMIFVASTMIAVTSIIHCVRVTAIKREMPNDPSSLTPGAPAASAKGPKR
jgi:hypothetical protein